jgi:diacylglycerol kinase family enzyme
MIVILNAGAGSVLKSGNMQSTMAKLFGTAHVNAEIISVAAKDVSATAKQAVAGHHETIVPAGGDGTPSTVAAEMAGTEKTLGVLRCFQDH